MSPGSLPDWPLEEQRVLFELLGETRKTIGVELTESLFMVPVKSLSGIVFTNEEGFASCQLCPREGCPGRRVPYEGSSKKKIGISIKIFPLRKFLFWVAWAPCRLPPSRRCRGTSPGIRSRIPLLPASSPPAPGAPAGGSSPRRSWGVRPETRSASAPCRPRGVPGNIR